VQFGNRTQAKTRVVKWSYLQGLYQTVQRGAGSYDDKVSLDNSGEMTK
jgi:hypothetical protein